MNFIGLLYNCNCAKVSGTNHDVKYLTGGLELGVQVTEQACSSLPAGWDFYRMFWMEYFSNRHSAAAKTFNQRYLCLLLGANNDAESLLSSLCDTNFNLYNLGITSKFLQNIGYKDFRLLTKSAWLPSMGLSSTGRIPFEVSKFLRGSGTLAKESDAVLQLRDGNTALVAQAEGFVMLRAFDDMKQGYPEQFIKQIHLFGLYKAYELAMQQATRKVSEALDEMNASRDKACSRLVELQETLAEFDARYYFESPVDPSRHELTKCAAFFSSFSTAHSQHNDLINQIERLGHLSRTELQIREERRQKTYDWRLQRTTFLVTFLALIFAAGQVFSQSPEQLWEVILQWGDLFKGFGDYFFSDGG